MRLKLSVAVGKTKEGKGIWIDAGSLIEKDGKKYVVIKRTFNPAGVPNPKGDDSVWLNVFEEKPTQHSVDKGNGYQPDDDMPPF